MEDTGRSKRNTNVMYHLDRDNGVTISDPATLHNPFVKYRNHK